MPYVTTAKLGLVKVGLPDRVSFSLFQCAIGVSCGIDGAHKLEDLDYKDGGIVGVMEYPDGWYCEECGEEYDNDRTAHGATD